MWARILSTAVVLSAVANLPAVVRADPPRPSAMHVTTGNGTLPNEQGQVWREYDISAYTSHVTSTKRPEQAVVDWILRETGYEVWHSQPLAILSVTPQTLRVYHTPRMQAVVAELVERFVASETETRTFNLRIIALDNPSWRARALRILRPVPVQTPGVCAWVLPKEDAAVLLADLQRRLEFHELGSPHLLASNGQSTVVSSMRSRAYIRDVVARAGAWQGLENVPGQLDEGFSIEFSPLVSVDRRTVDASIKCQVEQVERLVPALLELPSAVSARQRTRIDVPQRVQFHFNERFRWPVDQVLLVGLGMVPMPVPIDGSASPSGLPFPLPGSPLRADVLLLVESKPRLAEPAGATSIGPLRSDGDAFPRRSDTASPR